jgi:rSAM/selenodomain-associated transferase 1
VTAARTLVLLAKEPLPGRVKTRLHSEFSPTEAAALASAAIEDTVRVMAATRAAHRLVALDGQPGPWLPGGFEVVRQPEGDLGARLAAALDAGLDRGGPVLLVGMDTPQLSLDVSFEGADAVLGPTDDGGFWAVGLREHCPGAFDGVPMSTDHTGADQLARLRELGLTVRILPRLRDVDDPDDARAVALAHPGTGFAAEWRRLTAVDA